MVPAMLKTVPDLIRALRRGDYCGVVLYNGPSLIDGAPIIAIACRITEASENSKTGAMIQTFILRRDIAPHLALKTGADSSVCGDCPLRPIHKGPYGNVRLAASEPEPVTPTNGDGALP